MKKILMSLIAINLLLSGCARDIAPATYTAGSIGQVQVTYRGIIEKAEIINVEDKDYLGDNLTGAIGGGLVGGIIGNRVTRGPIGTVVGAMAGAAGGALIEKNLKKQQAALYTVKTESGGLLSITQGLDTMFSVGQKVRIIMGHGNNRTRILAD
jgi:outer membrane lipoprotein SlyB